MAATTCRGAGHWRARAAVAALALAALWALPTAAQAWPGWAVARGAGEPGEAEHGAKAKPEAAQAGRAGADFDVMGAWLGMDFEEALVAVAQFDPDMAPGIAAQAGRAMLSCAQRGAGAVSVLLESPSAPRLRQVALSCERSESGAMELSGALYLSDYPRGVAPADALRAMEAKYGPSRMIGSGFMEEGVPMGMGGAMWVGKGSGGRERLVAQRSTSSEEPVGLPLLGIMLAREPSEDGFLAPPAVGEP